MGEEYQDLLTQVFSDSGSTPNFSEVVGMAQVQKQTVYGGAHTQ